ncbi:hypothetical protein ACLOJK_037150 [Asimina triloba]
MTGRGPSSIAVRPGCWSRCPRSVIIPVKMQLDARWIVSTGFRGLSAGASDVVDWVGRWAAAEVFRHRVAAFIIGLLCCRLDQMGLRDFSL